MQSMNSGPQSFDTNKGPTTPTALDKKAEGARENSSGLYKTVSREPEISRHSGEDVDLDNSGVTIVKKGLRSDGEYIEKKFSYPKLSSEDVKKSGGIPTANHHYRHSGEIPQGSTFSNENQPARP